MVVSTQLSSVPKGHDFLDAMRPKEKEGWQQLRKQTILSRMTETYGPLVENLSPKTREALRTLTVTDLSTPLRNESNSNSDLSLLPNQIKILRDLRDWAENLDNLKLRDLALNEFDRLRAGIQNRLRKNYLSTGRVEYIGQLIETIDSLSLGDMEIGMQHNVQSPQKYQTEVDFAKPCHSCESEIGNGSIVIYSPKAKPITVSISDLHAMVIHGTIGMDKGSELKAIESLFL